MQLSTFDWSDGSGRCEEMAQLHENSCQMRSRRVQTAETMDLLAGIYNVVLAFT